MRYKSGIYYPSNHKCICYQSLIKNENEKKQKEKSLEKDLALLYSGLRLQPKNIYELMNETGFKYEELTGMLLKLQLMGLVEQPSENYYSKA